MKYLKDSCWQIPDKHLSIINIYKYALPGKISKIVRLPLATMSVELNDMQLKVIYAVYMVSSRNIEWHGIRRFLKFFANVFCLLYINQSNTKCDIRVIFIQT